jgi:oxygen-independent coproporphyrinogen-3 oxidase
MYSAAAAERYVRSLTNEITSWNEVERGRSPTPGSLAGQAGWRGTVREGVIDVDASDVDTIYFGGGTPSLLLPAQLATLLDAVHQRFEVSATAEVTIEINPGSATPENLRDFRSLGINRASFGAQTFDDRELARLGRSHTSDDTRRTFRYLRDAGFANVSFDLIAGLPGQTMDGWRRNLAESFALRPEHLSFYLLEVHQGTPLASHIKSGLQPQPDEDLATEMYEVMLDEAVAAGYEHYEISNLCLPGMASRHNTKYWTAAPYYGFGCSAHSYDGAFRRWSNERDPLRYVEMIEQQRRPVVEETRLSEVDRRAEAVFLGLRMMQGLSFQEFQRVFSADLREQHDDDLARFREAGLIECNGDLIKLTRAGALLSNEVFAAFV